MATEYLTNDTDLKAVADAIRTKAGSTAQLSFPDGFITAVNGIQTGGSGGAGFKVTFPATAKDWNMVSSKSVLYLADNTTKSIADYSSISGQTIENVIGIGCQSTNNAYVLRMNLSEGGIASALVATGTYPEPTVSIAPGSTPSYYMGGSYVFWWPVADTVISSIEMYNTD